MIVKTVEAYYRRVINRGDYNSEAAEARVVCELEPGDEYASSFERAEAQVRESVETQLKIIAPRSMGGRSYDEPTTPDWVGDPDAGPPPERKAPAGDYDIRRLQPSLLHTPPARQAVETLAPPPTSPADKATPAQVRTLYLIGGHDLGLTDAEVDQRAMELYGLTTTALSKRQASQFMAKLKGEKVRD